MFSFVSPHQMTPLHRAAGGGHVDIVEYLLGVGGDIHSKDRSGVSEGDYSVYYTKDNENVRE